MCDVGHITPLPGGSAHRHKSPANCRFWRLLEVLAPAGLLATVGVSVGFAITQYRHATRLDEARKEALGLVVQAGSSARSNLNFPITPASSMSSGTISTMPSPAPTSARPDTSWPDRHPPK